MRWLMGFITLFALWIAMSGVYKPLIIGLGAFSSALAVFFVHRMDRASVGAQLRWTLNPLATMGYLLWLVKEIAKSNWAVTCAIMTPEIPMNRNFFKVPFTQKTELPQAIFANSITLTPGTITVEVEDDYFWVHAVNYSQSDPADLADMDRRVLACEVA